MVPHTAVRILPRPVVPNMCATCTIPRRGCPISPCFRLFLIVPEDLVYAVPNKGNADALLNGDDMAACVVLFERGEVRRFAQMAARTRGSITRSMSMPHDRGLCTRAGCIHVFVSTH